VSDELSKLKLRLERLELLYQVSNVIHSTLEAQEALQLIVSEGVRLVKASSGSVVLLNPTSEFLEIHAAQNLPGPARKVQLRVGEGMANRRGLAM
jgi:signal transduction protein with GAF and PtsI domain